MSLDIQIDSKSPPIPHPPERWFRTRMNGAETNTVKAFLEIYKCNTFTADMTHEEKECFITKVIGILVSAGH